MGLIETQPCRTLNNMSKACLAFLLFGAGYLQAQPQHGLLVGEALKVDAASKTGAAKVAGGTTHTAHFVKQATVDGAQQTAGKIDDAAHGAGNGIAAGAGKVASFFKKVI